tara:strand:+ start:2066 stop:2383 length:318 start_codon:yes stop_codon:yes gene_type:complete
MAKKTTPKTTTLSNVEKFYIEEHVNTNIEELTKEIGKAQSLIQSLVDKIKEKQSAATKVDDLMARNDNGSVIMTQSASSLADDKRSKPKSPISRYNNSIHKIKDV